MANTRESSSRKSTSSGDERTNNGPEYHLTVGHNNGHLIAGHYNTITHQNVYNYLKIESPSRNNKKRSQKRIKKKKRQENVELNRDECSKNSGPVKGKKLGKNSPRKGRVLDEGQSYEESNDKHADQGLKTSDQEFITTSEDEYVESLDPVNDRLLANDDAENANILRYRPQNKENSSIKENSVSESESKLAYGNKSGDIFSPFRVAIRQAKCFAACIMFCCYFETLAFLPFLFWLIFVANNLLACFSCIKLTFKTIDYHDMPSQIDIDRSFIAIARLQVDFFIKEENILQRLFALLLCVSLGFVSSQIFGCATCLWMQTIVVTIVSTLPYLLFQNNGLLPFVLSEHCRVFKEGLESSGNLLC